LIQRTASLIQESLLKKTFMSVRTKDSLR